MGLLQSASRMLRERYRKKPFSRSILEALSKKTKALCYFKRSETDFGTLFENEKLTR